MCVRRPAGRPGSENRICGGDVVSGSWLRPVWSIFEVAEEETGQCPSWLSPAFLSEAPGGILTRRAGGSTAGGGAGWERAVQWLSPPPAPWLSRPPRGSPRPIDMLGWAWAGAVR